MDFSEFNGTADELRAQGIRIYGPKLNEEGERIGDASVAQDLEPEYITISSDSSTAWVTLQENNAIAILDIGTASVSSLEALGYKDHLLAGNGLDASDRDGGVNIANWPVKGMYQPDGIASFTVGEKTFLINGQRGRITRRRCIQRRSASEGLVARRTDFCTIWSPGSPRRRSSWDGCR